MSPRRRLPLLVQFRAEDRAAEQEADGIGACGVDRLVREGSEHRFEVLGGAFLELRMGENVEIVPADAPEYPLAALERIHPQRIVGPRLQLLLLQGDSAVAPVFF